MQGPESHSYFSQRLRLHYVDWGNPDAPPLLLIHGGRDHCRNWDWVAEALRNDYRIVAPDLRGHGDSSWFVGGAYAMADYVYDIAQLVHQKRLAPVTVIGHSLGGSIALHYAGVYPETVKALVAIEGLGPSPAQIEARGARSIDDRLREWIDTQRGLSGRLPRRYPSLEDAYRRMQEANPRLTGPRPGTSPSTAPTRTRTAPTAGSSTITAAPTARSASIRRRASASGPG